jgi:hypothetical protein
VTVGGEQQALGGVDGPSVLVARGLDGLALATRGLDTQQQGAGGVGGAHVVVGLGLALHGGDGVVGERAGVADAVPGLGVGDGDAGGDAGLLGVDGAHGGDLGDRGMDTLGDELGVGEVRGRDVGVEIGDDGAVDSLGELLEGVGRGLGGGRFGH